GGQGEREPMPHVPGTGPGKRVTGAGARTEGREASRQTSEVGAVCGKAARTVLCGGRPVMGVPTAISFLSLRSSSVFSIPRSRSAEGTDAESGTEAISLKRKELGGLPIAVGCTRSKTGRVPCLHICWAEQM